MMTHPHTHTHPHSGGTNYTITGTNLDSVQQPRLLFYVEDMAELGRRQRQTAGQNYVESQVRTHLIKQISTPPPNTVSINYHISTNLNNHKVAPCSRSQWYLCTYIPVLGFSPQGQCSNGWGWENVPAEGECTYPTENVTTLLKSAKLC